MSSLDEGYVYNKLRLSNFSIESEPGKKESFRTLEKKAMSSINRRYGQKAKLKYTYTGLIMETLIFNKNTHLVASFKNYMIWDYIEEFLKRFYHNHESQDRVPKFESFYKNYLKFFCRPTFNDFYINDLLHNYSEKKAELFYNANYRKKNEKESNEDEGLYEDSSSDSEEPSKVTKSQIEKTIFNEMVKKKIERYSPINTSMVLPDSEVRLKTDQSGLLITISNESSLINIMTNLNPPKMNTTNGNKKGNCRDKIKSNSLSNNNIEGEEEVISILKSQSQRIPLNSVNSQSQKLLISNFLKANLKGNGKNNIKINSQALKSLLNVKDDLYINSINKDMNDKKSNNSKLEKGEKPKINNYVKSSEFTKYTKNNTQEINSLNNKTNSSTNNVNNTINNNRKRNGPTSKIGSYIGIYKKKSIPKGRNLSKTEDGNGQKFQTQNLNNLNINNYIKNFNANLEINKNIVNSNNRNLSSINTYNINCKNNSNIEKSRNNPAGSLNYGNNNSNHINTNNIYKYASFEKINDPKNQININLLRNKNIELIIGQLKSKPLCTLKKFRERGSNLLYKEDKERVVFSADHLRKKNDNNNKKIVTGEFTGKHQNDNNHKFKISSSAYDFHNKNYVNKKKKGNTNDINVFLNNQLGNIYNNQKLYNNGSVISQENITCKRSGSFNNQDKNKKYFSHNKNSSHNNFNTLINTHKGSKSKLSKNMKSERKSDEVMKITFDGLIPKNSNCSNKNILNESLKKHEKGKSNNIEDSNNNHIHNVNININNQINIGSNHIQEILSFSEMNLKNNNSLKNTKDNNDNNEDLNVNKNKRFYSRNKNTSLDFMTSNGANNILNNNHPSTTINYKLNSGHYDIHYRHEVNNIFKTQNKIKETPKSNAKKIQIINNNIYKSMKTLFGNNHLNKPNSNLNTCINQRKNKNIINNPNYPTSNYINYYNCSKKNC